MKKIITLFLIALISTGCATKLQKNGLTGGFDIKQLENDIYRLSYGGNGYTTQETIQTYWLYTASEFALHKGYDGFEIISNTKLSNNNLGQSPKLQKASVVFIPMDIPRPKLEIDIKLLHHPINNNPPKIFDARNLKEVLDQHVNGKKCSMGNVCEHVHRYLYQEGTI